MTTTLHGSTPPAGPHRPGAPAPAFRIIVTGSRTWTNHDVVRDALAVAVYQNLPAVIVHGACPSGADAIASWWVRSLGRNLDVTEERHPAAWATHDDHCPPWHRGMRRCKRAGHRRNAEMAALGADLCLAFIAPCTDPRCHRPRPHDSHGTAGMVELCERAGIPVQPFRTTGRQPGSHPCPACSDIKALQHYLCHPCWDQLPASASRALNRHDTHAALRLLELHRQLRNQVPLHEIRITP